MHSSTWRKGAVALAAVIGLGVLAAPASANGFGGFGSGVYGFNFGGLYSNLENRIPYFAAFPPVYYSYPVPRTYGYSPFAYPPYVATPDLGVAPAPQTITNPYVETSAPAAADPQPKTVSAPTGGPLVVENPYFDAGPRVMHASRAL